ncbi:hypothetical protein JW935_17775 [candidate division KSB1 bacterium]|nr:hypothetical protein [candidate division KSB1 bacterium]
MICDDDILGNAWIYATFVHYRQVSARYLLSIKDLFQYPAKEYIINASELYHRISQDLLKFENDLQNLNGSYDSLKQSVEWTRETCLEQIQRLRDAKPLEVQAIGELEKVLRTVSL